MDKKLYIYWVLILWLFSPLVSCNQQSEPLLVDESAKTNEALSEARYLSSGLRPSLKDTTAIQNQIAQADQLWDSNRDSARELLLDAARSSYSLQYYAGIVHTLGRITSYHQKNGNSDSTIFYCRLIIYTADKLPKAHAVKELMEANIAISYYREGLYDSAFYYIYKSLNSLERLELSENTGRKHAFQIYIIAAAMWVNLDDPQTALPYIQKGKELSKHLDEPGYATKMISLLATTAFRKQNFDSAFILYIDILRRRHESLNPDGLVELYINLANLYIKKKPCNADSALYFAQEGVKLNNMLHGENDPSLFRPLFILGCAYVHKGEHDADTGNFRRAEAIFEQLEQLNRVRNIADGDIVNLYTNLATLKVVNHKQYDIAYSYSKKAAHLRDSLYNIAQLQQRAKMDARYRLSEKDKHLAQQQFQLIVSQKKIADKNVLILSILAAGSLCMMLLSWRYYYVRNKNRKLESNRALELLKARINGEEQERERIAYDLHDSVNSRLAATQSYLVALQQEHPFLARQQDFNRIVRNLSDTSDEVRQIAHNLAPKELVEKNLPQVVKEFCSDILTPKGIDFDVQVIGDLSLLTTDFSLTMYRIIQELIQNIIKHAEASHVLVILNKEKTAFSLLMEDNGNGQDWPKPVNNKNGIGIAGIHNRIKSLHGTLHRETRQGKGTTIHITTPMPETQ